MFRGAPKWHDCLDGNEGLEKNMEAWASSLIVGILFAVSLTWLVSLINDRYIKREKYLSRLILKCAKKE
jgi:hypothetical protein